MVAIDHCDKQVVTYMIHWSPSAPNFRMHVGRKFDLWMLTSLYFKKGMSRLAENRIMQNGLQWSFEQIIFSTNN